MAYKYPTLEGKRDQLFDQESQVIKGNKIAWSTTYGGGNPWINSGPGRDCEDYSGFLNAGKGKPNLKNSKKEHPGA